MTTPGNEFLDRTPQGFGAYLCARSAGARPDAAALMALCEGLGLVNEFDGKPTAGESVAFLRRQGGAVGASADDDVLHADWVIHVASRRDGIVESFCREALKVLAPARVRVLSGVIGTKNYTGAAMNNWAYARQVVQQPAAAMPNAFLVPMSKTAEWWKKGWMERHTYFLPHYDDQGRMLSEGHALAAAAGIPCMLRRTYRHPVEPAPEGTYDFVTYFECADADVPTFHAVCEALRDVARNPEWRFVREGPTWHGRRVASARELLAQAGVAR
jgi:hypothetical protein